jgi:hypothetical protein
VKRTEEIMEILAAYDLTGSFRDAAALVGCDHPTLAHYVRARDAGQVSSALQRRDQRIDPFREKVEGVGRRQPRSGESRRCSPQAGGDGV